MVQPSPIKGSLTSKALSTNIKWRFTRRGRSKPEMQEQEDPARVYVCVCVIERKAHLSQPLALMFVPR